MTNGVLPKSGLQWVWSTVETMGLKIHSMVLSPNPALNVLPVLIYLATGVTLT